jgi:MFS superfamily sulfate permease-like transporter
MTINNKKMKSLKLKKTKISDINKKIKNVRIEKTISKKNIEKIKNKITNLEEKKNKIKIKYNKLETFEHSDFYIITNNLKHSFEELKNIYKKRWCVETSFRFDKTVLNLNQMNNKNAQLIKQNVYIMQFVCIMNAFINKLLEKIIMKDYYLNKTQIFESLHKNIFDLLKKLLTDKKCKLEKKIQSNNKKNKKHKKNKKYIIKKELINKLLTILKILSRYQLKNPKENRSHKRIKKRQSNNKFNVRNTTKINE